MNRAKLLERIKALDEQDILPYLYRVMSDGSAMAEKWLDDLEDRNIHTDKELFDALAEMGMM